MRIVTIASTSDYPPMSVNTHIAFVNPQGNKQESVFSQIPNETFRTYMTRGMWREGNTFPDGDCTTLIMPHQAILPGCDRVMLVTDYRLQSVEDLVTRAFKEANHLAIPLRAINEPAHHVLSISPPLPIPGDSYYTQSSVDRTLQSFIDTIRARAQSGWLDSISGIVVVGDFANVKLPPDWE